MQIHGRCHCGAIEFTALIDPAKVFACHCTDCQTMSGAPFRAVVPVAAEALSLSGTPKVYIKTAQSGNRRAQGFCGECGTPLYATSADQPTHYGLRLGCVDERARLAPNRQVWTRSAMPWLQDLHDVPASPEQ
ncbi:GFA family protein [Leptothrix discophora]|uniref:GFA family protein n=1 Tax=Leptothrix discophora TaxID=89 RepID=A0ABT9FYV2_LEPDI|nr:GFA family protein [Leptothrix discophora]MDP4299393.1 GFA family protein [Leptothrix discophora]